MFSDRFYNRYRDDSGHQAVDAMNALWALIAANILCFVISGFGSAFDRNVLGGFRSPGLVRMMLFS